MTTMHQDNLAQYQREAEENNRLYKELLELQHQKEAKEAEATQLSELQIKIDDLRQQIKILAEQAQNLRAENQEKLDLLKRQSEEEIARLTAELQQLIDHCKALRVDMETSQSMLDKLSAQYHEECARLAEIREQAHRLKQEAQAISAQLMEVLRGIESEPFQNEDFCRLLQELTDRRWRFCDLKDIQKHIATVEKDIMGMQTRHDKYERMSEKLSAALARLNEEMERLKQEIDALRRRHGVELMGFKSHDVVFAEGSSHVRVETHVLEQLAAGETAIAIEFREFTLTAGILKPNHRKIFLLVDFLGFRPINGQVIDVTNGTFETMILFKRANDYDLRDYLERQGPRVELCAKLGAKYERVAEGMLDLRPFLQGKESFAGTLSLIENGQPAGQVQFEALIYRELIQ
jgi:myosin heavy subunit